MTDFGGVGLLQMPTARFADDGELAVGYSAITPYNRFYVTVQALPWLEGSLRYTEVENRPFGPEFFSGDQTYKDRGVDLKARLWRESEYLPEVAVGFRDLGGTSLFSSEFLVASKRYYDWDFHAGLAWGYAGSRGGISNPLSSDPRAQRGREAGAFDLGQLFSGAEMAPYGGIEYRGFHPDLSVRLEWDGNDYQSEPLSNNQDASLPVNAGVTYRPFDWLDLSLGVERGNTVMFQVALRANLNRDRGFPKFDPAPMPVAKRPWRPASQVAYGALSPTEFGNGATISPDLAEALREALEEQDLRVEAVGREGDTLVAHLSQGTYRQVPRTVGRASRILASQAPEGVERLQVVVENEGLPTSALTLSRRDLERAVAHELSAEELWLSTDKEEPPMEMAGHYVVNEALYPELDWSTGLNLRRHIGGPDNFFFWQIMGRASADVRLSRNFSVTGSVGVGLADNLEDLKLESNSVLPRVRSDIAKYLKDGDLIIPRLQADYLWRPARHWYARASAGLFEEMFGGVGGEVLYRRMDRRWAFGVDVNWVRQRDYDSRFTFRDYDVVTGHGTLYYEPPFRGVRTALRVGRYLAGDYGATFEVSRRFDNGVVFGAFATQTDVSAEDFGEGSFDKGLYFSMPLDLFTVTSTRTTLSDGWRPVTRDGGQRLGIGKRLYGLTSSDNLGALERDWDRVLD